MLDKLSLGVLRVLTPLGPRYVTPSLVQRVYLLWIFRNFQTLPAKVLSLRQRQWIDRMCTAQGFVSLLELSKFGDLPVLGTLEQRPLMEAGNLPPRRPNQSVTTTVSFAADAQQRS